MEFDHHGSTFHKTGYMKVISTNVDKNNTTQSSISRQIGLTNHSQSWIIYDSVASTFKKMTSPKTWTFFPTKKRPQSLCHSQLFRPWCRCHGGRWRCAAAGPGHGLPWGRPAVVDSASCEDGPMVLGEPMHGGFEWLNIWTNIWLMMVNIWLVYG